MNRRLLEDLRAYEAGETREDEFVARHPDSAAALLIDAHKTVAVTFTFAVPSSGRSWTALARRLPDHPAPRTKLVMRRSLVLAFSLTLVGGSAMASGLEPVRRVFGSAWQEVSTPFRPGTDDGVGGQLHGHGFRRNDPAAAESTAVDPRASKDVGEDQNKGPSAGATHKHDEGTSEKRGGKQREARSHTARAPGHKVAGNGRASDDHQSRGSGNREGGDRTEGARNPRDESGRDDRSNDAGRRDRGGDSGERGGDGDDSSGRGDDGGHGGDDDGDSSGHGGGDHGHGGDGDDGDSGHGGDDDDDDDESGGHGGDDGGTATTESSCRL